MVEADKATQIIINECLEDGTVISTTYAKTNKMEEKLDALMMDYTKTFGEGFPSFQVFRGRETQECIDIVEKCLRERKDAYELGYTTDEEGIKY